MAGRRVLIVAQGEGDADPDRHVDEVVEEAGGSGEGGAGGEEGFAGE